MTRFVVDSSVVTKWFVPEVHSAAALAYLRTGATLVAPDLLLPELGNVLWKKVRAREIDASTGRRIARRYQALPVRLVPSIWLLPPALELALELGRSVYDSLYLALAKSVRCPMVTADRRLLNAVRATRVSGCVRWVEEAPTQ